MLTQMLYQDSTEQGLSLMQFEIRWTRSCSVSRKKGPVEIAECAAPIVPVLKQDRASVRICGDFSVTVNPVSKLDKYPIPKVEDLFVRLSKGKYFSKLDLSCPY